MFNSGFKKNMKELLQQYQLILMILPGVVSVFIFNYIPIYGIIIAFKDFNPGVGLWASEWVGLKYFQMFFESPYTVRLITNTFILGLYSILWGFPAPIILALLLDQLRNARFKKFVQTVTLFPHFISFVVIVGLIREFTGMDGVFNSIITFFGGMPIPFLAESSWFRTIFIGSGLWQGIGWGTVIYLAALSNVDPQLQEAARIDGANRWQLVRHISWPTILPTTTILLIFSISGILGADFSKVLLLYSEATYETADIIGTYVYREGITGGRYEYSAAIGLMLNVVAFVFVYLANWFSRRVSENSLW